VVDSSIPPHVIVGTSCAVLVVLFALQPLGITKLSSTFAPIVVIWLLFNMAFGIYVSSCQPSLIERMLIM
jgi:KUP system potassium uptake protein